MFIDQFKGRPLLFDLPPDRLPPNFATAYTADFVIEEYQVGVREGQPIVEEHIYLRFKEKTQRMEKGQTEPKHFRVRLSSQPRPPGSTFHLLSITPGEERADIGPRIDSKLEAHLEGNWKGAKVEKEVIIDPDPDDFLYELPGGFEQEEQDESPQPALLDLTPQNEGAVKKVLLGYFETDEHRFHSIKQIKAHLKASGCSLSDANTKKVLASLCVTPLDKKRGYVVRDQYLTHAQREKRLREEQARRREINEKVSKNTARRESQAKRAAKGRK